MSEKKTSKSDVEKPDSAQGTEDEQQLPRTYLSDDELAHFKKLILDKRSDALAEIDEMKSRLEDAQENSSGYTYHMADSGTDAMEREMLYLMISRQQKFIGYLDRALKRIESKTYGVCKITGHPIPKERLEAVPHTETTVEAKMDQKKRGQ